MLNYRNQHKRKRRGKVIPLISTYYSNYDNSTGLQMAQNVIDNSKDERIKSAFKDAELIHAYKQPATLLRILSNSSFIHQTSSTQKEVFLNVQTKDVKFVNYTYNRVPHLFQLMVPIGE